MINITDLRDELEDCAAEAAMIGAAIRTLNDVDDEEVRYAVGVFASKLSARLARLSDDLKIRGSAREPEIHASERAYSWRQA
jgi:hypothetical protein